MLVVQCLFATCVTARCCRSSIPFNFAAHYYVAATRLEDRAPAASTTQDTHAICDFYRAEIGGNRKWDTAATRRGTHMVTESNAPDADIARRSRGSRPGGRASIAIKRWRDNAFTSTRDGIVQKTLSGENGRSRKGNAPIAGNIFMKSRSQGIGVRTRGKASVAVQNDRQGAVCPSISLDIPQVARPSAARAWATRSTPVASALTARGRCATCHAGTEVSARCARSNLCCELCPVASIASIVAARSRG